MKMVKRKLETSIEIPDLTLVPREPMDAIDEYIDSLYSGKKTANQVSSRSIAPHLYLVQDEANSDR